MTDPRDATLALIEAIWTRTPSDFTEVALTGGRLHVVRFDDNYIQENSEERWVRARLRSAVQHADALSEGVVYTTDLSEEGIDEALTKAHEAALTADPLDDFEDYPWPDEFESLEPLEGRAFDASTALAGPAMIADQVSAAVLPARRLGYLVSGFYAISVGALDPRGAQGVAAIGSNHGLFQYHHATSVSYDLQVVTPYGGVYRVFERASRISGIDPVAMFERAAARAELPLAAFDVIAGRFDAVLEHTAVAALMQLLGPHFTFEHVAARSSVFAMREDETLFGEQITISVDPGHSLLLARPFDTEGWPRRTFDLIRRGSVANLVYSRYEAQAMGGSPSGYAPDDDPHGLVVPDALVMAGSEDWVTAEDLAATMGSGLLIGHLERVRLQDERRMLVKATAHGVFTVDGGTLTAQVPPFGVTIDLGRVLGDDAILGSAIRVDNMIAPPLYTTEIEVASE